MAPDGVTHMLRRASVLIVLLAGVLIRVASGAGSAQQEPLELIDRIDDY